MKTENLKRLGKFEELSKPKNISYATISNSYIKDMKLVKLLIGLKKEAVV